MAKALCTHTLSSATGLRDAKGTKAPMVSDHLAPLVHLFFSLSLMPCPLSPSPFLLLTHDTGLGSARRPATSPGWLMNSGPGHRAVSRAAASYMGGHRPSNHRKRRAEKERLLRFS